MLSLSVPNVITVALISVAAIAAVRFGLKYAGMDTSWL